MMEKTDKNKGMEYTGRQYEGTGYDGKEELHKLVKREQPNICQIVAYKNNEKVYSDCWNEYVEDDCTHIMSATKSIMSLLIGIALDKGQLGSVDDKVLDYFPDYTIPTAKFQYASKIFSI